MFLQLPQDRKAPTGKPLLPNEQLQLCDQTWNRMGTPQKTSWRSHRRDRKQGNTLKWAQKVGNSLAEELQSIPPVPWVFSQLPPPFSKLVIPHSLSQTTQPCALWNSCCLPPAPREYSRSRRKDPWRAGKLFETTWIKTVTTECQELVALCSICSLAAYSGFYLCEL